MEPFASVEGIVVPLNRVNVDTDQVIPARHLKRIEKTGYGPFLFERWRYLPDGSVNPEFELNHLAYQGAQILVTGGNFGCGSSREHAVWALRDYGFRAIIAPSFADIFHKNCLENGVVPVLLDQNIVNRIISKGTNSPGYKLIVDLEQCEVRDQEGFTTSFVIHSDPKSHKFRRFCLLNGLDDIGLTLIHENDILDYERHHGYSS